MRITTDNGDGTITISGPCTFTNEEYSCIVPKEGYNKFLLGEHIQNVMPEVPSEDREFVISGISPKGWDSVFGEEDE